MYLSKNIIAELSRLTDQIKYNIDNAIVPANYFKWKTVEYKGEFYKGLIDASTNYFNILVKFRNSITDNDEYMYIKKNISTIYDEIIIEKYKIENKLLSCSAKSKLESYLTGYISGILIILNMLDKLFSTVAKGELEYANKNIV